MEAVFQDCIREVKAEGRTVLLSSHILAEVEALCDQVSIIRSGRTQESGTLARAATPDPHVDHRARPTRPAGRVARPRRGPRSRGSTGTVCASTSTPSTSTRRSRRLSELGIRSLVSHPPTLEELFLRHYGDELARERELAERARDDRP